MATARSLISGWLVLRAIVFKALSSSTSFDTNIERVVCEEWVGGRGKLRFKLQQRTYSEMESLHSVEYCCNKSNSASLSMHINSFEFRLIGKFSWIFHSLKLAKILMNLTLTLDIHLYGQSYCLLPQFSSQNLKRGLKLSWVEGEWFWVKFE